MRYRLRTLLIVLALIPPLLAMVAPPLMQWLAPRPIPATPTAINNAAPYFASYPIGKAGPRLVHNVATTLLAGMPNTRLALDEQTGTLVVLAPRPVHASVKAIISAIQNRSSQSDFSATRVEAA